jgi:putative membrane protein
MKVKKQFIIFLKGLAMGVADAIPGISGATIALITGIYEKLIQALTPEQEDIKNVLLSLSLFDTEKTVETLREMDLPFLISLGAGIITALILMLNLASFMLSNFFVSTYGYFLGLIGISGILMLQQIDLGSKFSMTSFLAGLILSVAASSLSPGLLSHSNTLMLLSGALAVSAMVLPGISGSLVLIILGQYNFISKTVSETTRMILKPEMNLENIVNQVTPLLYFCTGAFIGLFTFAHIIERCLKNYRQATLSLLVALVIGALSSPLIQVNRFLIKNNYSWISKSPEFLTAAALGGISIYLVNHWTEESFNI